MREKKSKKKKKQLSNDDENSQDDQEDKESEMYSVYSMPNKYKEKEEKNSHKCGISKDGTPLCGSGKDLDPILDPLFNLREVCKQMILLEDHLFQPKRRCEDCIKKHSLAIEGFLEEAITLDIGAKYHKLINDTIFPFKKLMKSVDNKMKEGKLDDETCVNVAQGIRLLRKELCLVSYSS